MRVISEVMSIVELPPCSRHYCSVRHITITFIISKSQYKSHHLSISLVYISVWANGWYRHVLLATYTDTVSC